MVVQGILHLNSDGRYCFDDYTYFTSGSFLEVLFYGRWVKTFIECDSFGRYYATALPDLCLDGFHARVKI